MKRFFILMLMIFAMFSCTEVSEDTDNNDNYNDNYSDNTTNDNTNTDNNTNNDNYNDNYNDNNTNTSYTVYFYAGEVNWDEVYVYSWDDYNKNEAWPGERMSSDGNGWYSATVNYPKIIFNGGNGGPQTGNLTSQDGYFVPENSGSSISGTWYTSKPNVGNNPEPDYPDYPDDPEPDYPDDPYYPDEPEEISAPSYLTANATSESSISLSWYSVSGATYYAVYYGTSSSTYSAECYDYYTGTSAQITNLYAGTKYYFWVIATDGTLISDFSNMAYATTEEEEVIDLVAPVINATKTRTNLLTTDKKGFSITVSSNDTYVDSRTEKYRLYRSQEKFDNYQLIKEVNAGNFSFVFEDRTVDMTPGNVYYYKVSAVCGKSEVESTNGIEIKVAEPYIVVSGRKGTWDIDLGEGGEFSCTLSSSSSTKTLKVPVGRWTVKIKYSTGSSYTTVGTYDFHPMYQYSLDVVDKAMSNKFNYTSNTDMFAF